MGCPTDLSAARGCFHDSHAVFFIPSGLLVCFKNTYKALAQKSIEKLDILEAYQNP